MYVNDKFITRCFQLHIRVGSAYNTLHFFKANKLQKMMLPSYHRQLVLLDQNTTDHHHNIKVHRFHHPISIISNIGQNIAQKLACRDGSRLMTNYYKESKKSWITPFGVDSLDLERSVLYRDFYFLLYCIMGTIFQALSFWSPPLVWNIHEWKWVRNGALLADRSRDQRNFRRCLS